MRTYLHRIIAILLTWNALSVLSHSIHVCDRVLTRVEDAPSRVNVGRRYDTDKVLENVEGCAERKSAERL